MANTPAQLDALRNLRDWLPVGSTLYTILRGVSRSGATRRVTLMGLRAQRREGSWADEGVPFFPHRDVATVLGLKLGAWEGHDTVILPGFTPQGWIAENLSWAIHGDPTAITERAI